MLEMRRAVAQPDLRRHADPGEEILLERGDVERRIGLARACRSRSSIAQAVYSTVAKPWLKLRAASSLSISASGIGSPVW